MAEYNSFEIINFENRRFCYFSNYDFLKNKFIQIDNKIVIENIQNKSLNFVGIVKLSKNRDKDKENYIGISTFMLHIIGYPKKVIVKLLIDSM